MDVDHRVKTVKGMDGAAEKFRKRSRMKADDKVKHIGKKYLIKSQSRGYIRKEADQRRRGMWCRQVIQSHFLLPQWTSPDHMANVPNTRAGREIQCVAASNGLAVEI